MVRISLLVVRDQIMSEAFFLYVMRKYWKTDDRSDTMGFVSIKNHSGCYEN